MKSVLGITIALSLLGAGTASAQSEFFSIDSSEFRPQATGNGQDLIYFAPGAEERFVNYTAVMVDQPEVRFAPDSPYRGIKPEDVAAIAALVRYNLTTELAEGGYAVVEQPGPGVLFMRSAVSDLYIKKDRRKLRSFTPVGMVVHVSKTAVSETLEKIDIIEMSLEAELADSQTGEVLGAALLQRGQQGGSGRRETRMDIDELVAEVQEYSERFRCRLDNSRMPREMRIDCNDVTARKQRGM